MGTLEQRNKLNLDIEFSKGKYTYTVDNNETDFLKIYDDLKQEYQVKLKKDLLEINQKLIDLENQSALIDSLEMFGRKIIALEKSDDFYVEQLLPQMPERTFLKVKLDGGDSINKDIKKLHSLVENFMEDIDIKMMKVKKLLNVDDEIESETVKKFVSLGEEFIQEIELFDTQLKQQESKVKAYLEVLKDFDFEIYLTNFQGYGELKA